MVCEEITTTEFSSDEWVGCVLLVYNMEAFIGEQCKRLKHGCQTFKWHLKRARACSAQEFCACKNIEWVSLNKNIYLDKYDWIRSHYSFEQISYRCFIRNSNSKTMFRCYIRRQMKFQIDLLKSIFNHFDH